MGEDQETPVTYVALMMGNGQQLIVHEDGSNEGRAKIVDQINYAAANGEVLVSLPLFTGDPFDPRNDELPRVEATGICIEQIMIVTSARRSEAGDLQSRDSGLVVPRPEDILAAQQPQG